MEDREREWNWGEMLDEKLSTKVKFLEEECTMYKSFELDGFKVNVGDDVLIRCINSDGYVARVTTLYDTGAKNDGSHRALVHWYCRLKDINRRFVKALRKYPTPPYEWQELYADRRDKCVNDIDAETIFKKCTIIKSDINLSDLPPPKDESPNYFLRWKYFGDSLVPVISDSAQSTPVSSKTKISYVKNDDAFSSCDSDESSYPNRCNKSKVLHFKVKSPDKFCCTPTSPSSRLKLKLIRTQNSHLRQRKSKSCRKDTELCQTVPKAKKKLQLGEKENETVVRSNFGRKISPNKRYLDDSLTNKSKDVSPLLQLRKECVVHLIRTPTEKSCQISKDASKNSSKKTPSNNISKPDSVTPSFTPAKSGNSKPRFRRNIIFSEDESCSPVKRSKPTPSKSRKLIQTTRSGRKIKIRLWDDGIKAIDSEGLANDDEDYSGHDTDDSEPEINSRKSSVKRHSKSAQRRKTQTGRRLTFTPSLPKRTTSINFSKSDLEQAIGSLHVSAVPESLPCREQEFAEIYTFVEGKIATQTGGCMYLSGVPGTGKTATVTGVIKYLQTISEEGQLQPFKFLTINGMQLTEPRQAYVQIYKNLCGQKVTAAHAVKLLCKYFETGKNESVVLLVDELDLLWNRKQDVLYSLFNWPSKPKSRLVVIAIANTMDLPERIMKNRIASRLGLTRITFQPYNFRQLQQILLSRLSQNDVFDSDSVQFIARKVAAISGDARRALDICRRAAELVGKVEGSPSKKAGSVGMAEADRAIQEMFSSPKIEAIRSASLQERTFLKAVVCEFQRTGVEESTFNKIYKQHLVLCRVEGIDVPNSSEAMATCLRLGSCRLLLLENGQLDILQRVRLNIGTDDVTFALSRPRVQE